MKLPIKTLTALAATAAIPVAVATAAQAAPADQPHDAAQSGTVYFSAAGFGCSINDNGDVGCDNPSGVPMAFKLSDNFQIPLPFRAHEVVIDFPWAPAHPAFDAGTPHTLPGGNPPISQVGHPVGSGANAGSRVDHAGASCFTGFHGSFQCTSKGHGFTYYEQVTAW